MNKALKGFLTGLALAALILAPACKSNSKKNPPVGPTVVPQDTAPNVAVVTPQPPAPTEVKPPADFVDEHKIATDELPSNTEELNRYVQERGYIRDAFYGYDEATLSPEAQEALTASANWLKSNARYNLLLEGHCDERGTEQYNLALGDKRAQQAKDYLVASGVDASRIRTVSYGEERPFDPGHDESSWSKNRRAHLVLVGK
jgi:peptidoglycan-associated lipoprotein